MFPNRIRYFNKHITNRILRRFASSSRGPFAVIYHVGRRSGKPYETTIMVWPRGDGFVIALKKTGYLTYPGKKRGGGGHLSPKGDREEVNICS